MKKIKILALLLCCMCNSHLFAQVLTDWEFCALKGKVKQVIEVKTWGSETAKTRVVTHYDEQGFIENIRSYVLMHENAKEDYLGKIVYERYVGNQRKAISFDEKETMLQGITYKWTVNNATKIYTAKFGGVVTDRQQRTLISVFNAKNQKVSEKFFEWGEDRFHNPFNTVEKLFEYDEKGSIVAYEQIEKLEQDNYLEDKKSFKLMNETFDRKGNVTKQQIMLKGQLFCTIDYVYSYY